MEEMKRYYRRVSETRNKSIEVNTVIFNQVICREMQPTVISATKSNDSVVSSQTSLLTVLKTPKHTTIKLQDKLSFCSSGWSQTHCVAQAGLKPEILASAPRVLRHQMHTCLAKEGNISGATGTAGKRQAVVKFLNK